MTIPAVKPGSPRVMSRSVAATSRFAHTPVPDSPSKVTAPISTVTNATRPGTGGICVEPRTGGRNPRCRLPSMWRTSTGLIVASSRVNTAKTSPLWSHVSTPNRSIAATVRTL